MELLFRGTHYHMVYNGELYNTEELRRLLKLEDVYKRQELADALYEAVEARDLPGMADVDASLLLLCRAMKPTATVALSGECADEIFGGYPWYRDCLLYTSRCV